MLSPTLWEIRDPVWSRFAAAGKLESDWTTYRIDVWARLEAFRRQHPDDSLIIRELRLYASGAGAAFDHIRLARSENDLKAVEPDEP